MTKSSFDAVVDVIEALQAHDIPYMLVGAFSSNAYGYPLATNDADFVIDYKEGDLTKIRESLGNEYFLDPQMSFELKTGSTRNILTFRPTKFDIELFRLGKDPHHQLRFSRRRRLQLPDLNVEAVIPTAEDVIIQKVRWQREKDIADARLVIQVQAAKLDWDYIRHWTEQHGTSNLLDKLKSEIGHYQ